MKKMILALVVCAVFSLTGCGGRSEEFCGKNGMIQSYTYIPNPLKDHPSTIVTCKDVERVPVGH